MVVSEPQATVFIVNYWEKNYKSMNTMANCLHFFHIHQPVPASHIVGMMFYLAAKNMPFFV